MILTVTYILAETKCKDCDKVGHLSKRSSLCEKHQSTSAQGKVYIPPYRALFNSHKNNTHVPID